MKVMIYEKYGPPEVLHLAQVQKPVPKDDEVLVRIKATTVTAGDWRMRKAEPFAARIYNGLFKPRRVKVLGFELAGVVEDIGVKVSRFKVGDEVFGFSGMRFGAYAEYKCLPDTGNQNKGFLAKMPANLSFAEAAAIPTGALAALNNIRKAAPVNGSKVLINGASGSVGTYAVQIAAHLGAEVTAVCSEKNEALVRSLGATSVIDYTQENLIECKERFDLVFDAVSKLPRSDARKLLASNGVYRDVGMGRKDTYQDLEFIASLVGSGAIKPVIDKQFTFEHIPDAHRYVEQGHKRGNVVVVL